MSAVLLNSNEGWLKESQELSFLCIKKTPNELCELCVSCITYSKTQIIPQFKHHWRVFITGKFAFSPFFFFLNRFFCCHYFLGDEENSAEVESLDSNEGLQLYLRALYWNLNISDIFSPLFDCLDILHSRWEPRISRDGSVSRRMWNYHRIQQLRSKETIKTSKNSCSV